MRTGSGTKDIIFNRWKSTGSFSKGGGKKDGGTFIEKVEGKYQKKDACNYFLIELSYFEQHRYRW